MRPLVPATALLLLASAASAACAPPRREAGPTTPPPPPRTPASAAATTAPDPPPQACEGDTFGVSPEVAAEVAARFEKKRGTMTTASRQMVASSHRLATEAGLAVLRGGGNAADAFVAAALAQDVVLPGVTSTAGLAGVLVYDAKTRSVTYVHGGLADALDPARRHRPGETTVGKHVLVPGAPAAYAEIARRFGSRRLRDLVEPAARLAADGFPADALYAATIASRSEVLRRSDFGQRSFFRAGKPIAAGETVQLGLLASTLRKFGGDPAWFYRGPWAREAVARVAAAGGALNEEDFRTYALEVGPSLHARVLGHDVHGGGQGGAKLLVTLQALERLRGGGAVVSSPATSVDALERLLRIERATIDLPLLHDRALFLPGSAIDGAIAKAVDSVVERAPHVSVEGTGAAGTHSSAVVVVDAAGNVVVGTHTIQTQPWGEGLFVGGVPLATAAPAGLDDATVATSRIRLDGLSNAIVMKDGRVRAALAVYGVGLHPADMQILDAVLTRGASAEDAVLEPRVGYFEFDAASMRIDYRRSAADPRLDTKLLCLAKGRGFTLERSMPGYPPGIVDTGFPTLVTLGPARIQGMTPELMNGVAAGD